MMPRCLHSVNNPHFTQLLPLDGMGHFAIVVGMRYIVDACNLMFRDDALETALEKGGFPEARQMLVSMLSRFAHTEKLDAIVAVFDGSEKGSHLPRRQTEATGKVMLVYADPREDADRHIIALVEDSPRPAEMTVITNDKFIIRNVRRAGGKQLGCRQFLNRMKQSARYAADPHDGEEGRKWGGTLTEREIGEWMDYFGFAPGE